MSEATVELVDKIVEMAKALKIYDALKDALNERVEAKDTSILGQKWVYDEDHIGGIIRESKTPGVAVGLNIWLREIAAMPDAYRALDAMCKHIHDLELDGHDSRSYFETLGGSRYVCDMRKALKKAGIE